MRRLWVVEIRTPGGNWEPQVACLSWHEADRQVQRYGRAAKARIAEYGPLQLDPLETMRRDAA